MGVDSPVRCHIDLDAHGKHFGHVAVPRSSNSAGWSSLRVPIVSIANGRGPSALVIGGVHGDEPEGQVAALNLARETAVGDVNGQLIVIPCLSMEAARAYTRLWPSGADLNRSFPGSPDGSIDEQLADFVARSLIPRVDAVIDMHSGGRGSMHLPWAEMHLVENPEQRREMADAMLAWNTDYCVVYIDIAGNGVLTEEAERQGKIVVATELGGGGHVTAATHRIADGGLRNVLRHIGVLTGQVTTREAAGRPPARILAAIEVDDYVFAPETGLFEAVVDLGQPVSTGDPLGRMHFLERPDRPGEVVHARADGIVCVVRAIAATTQGDCVAVVGREWDRSTLYGMDTA
jgi:predicted deacylase